MDKLSANLIGAGCQYKRRWVQYVILILSIFFPIHSSATRYTLANPTNMLIGQLSTTQARLNDTLLDIARRHGLGYHEIKLSNPNLDTWSPGEGQKINLPLQFILPSVPKIGIVLNMPEMRLYYYPPGKKNEVHTYPIGIGRTGWTTPYLLTKIIEKKERPEWHPPESIRAEYEAAGAPLPKVVAAGSDNPLGDYAMRLGISSYLIHGTNRPYGVGMRVSHGCIRLYPEDIESIFRMVPVDTPVNIINQPYKIGIQNNIIYLEAHPFLKEHQDIYKNRLTPMMATISELIRGRDHTIDWSIAFAMIGRPTGVPASIGLLLPDIQE